MTKKEKDLIKQLSRLTSANSVSCRKALLASDYNIEKAEQWLEANFLTRPKTKEQEAKEGICVVKKDTEGVV
jgi:translation elongation factor EF-Ts